MLVFFLFWVIWVCFSSCNPILLENRLPGAPSTEWDINGAGDETIQGFATSMSANRGETIYFKIKTDSSDYRVDIFRAGFYSGLGARLITSFKPQAHLPQNQPECFHDPITHLYDCGNWNISAWWKIPSTATSGVYFARLVRQDHSPSTWRADNSPAGQDVRFAIPGEGLKKPEPQAHAYGALGYGKLQIALKEPQASHIYFIVRDDESTSDILFQTSDTTWQAYNNYGGTSTYGSFDPAHPRERCYKSSYNRPLSTRNHRATNAFFGAEYPMIRFLERNGYDVSYLSGVDTHRWGQKLLGRHKVFLSVGHDEYWSGQQRQNVERARDAGLHLGFFSGNEVFWRIRWEDSPVSGDPFRTMVCYKETQSLTKLDPVLHEWTGTFRDARAINPLGAQPENALTGTIFTVNAWRNDPLVVPGWYAPLRFWRHTRVARLQAGERALFLRGILGHEWDEDIDNGFRPKGLIHLSETVVHNVEYIQDHGSIYDSGSGKHHLCLHRSNNSLVFGAGTVQWPWALDPYHDGETGMPAERANHLNIRVGQDLLSPDPDIQQATVNLFADMDVQPASLETHLIRAESSKDIHPPTSVIRFPVVGAHLNPGPLEIEVEARDTEGVVAAVEVSTDGIHWHPASPKFRQEGDHAKWIFDWNVNSGESLQQVTLQSRATDDSCNTEFPSQLHTVFIHPTRSEL